MDPNTEPDPDPLVRGTDLGIRIRIRTQMSRIPNTVPYQLEPEGPRGGRGEGPAEGGGVQEAG